LENEGSSGMNRIIISRTDAIGDVILTLPVAFALKGKYPGCEIIFLGRKYTRPVVAACPWVNTFLEVEELLEKSRKEGVRILKDLKADAIVHVFPNKKVAALAKQAGIPVRIGTSHRIFHWLTCNKPVNFTRKNSDLHEAQLNFKLLKPLGVFLIPSLDFLKSLTPLVPQAPLPDFLKNEIPEGKRIIILHPKSRGSAREWGLENFSSLISMLPPDNFHIFITGTAGEGELMKGRFDAFAHVTNLSGRLNLSELMTFISKTHALIAASTGPLHIAAALGIKAIGIFAPMRPIHPGRWAPLGPDAHALVLEKKCSDCRKSGVCLCIQSVSPAEVHSLLS
jgi:heptosyltransferase III